MARHFGSELGPGKQGETVPENVDGAVRACHGVADPWPSADASPPGLPTRFVVDTDLDEVDRIVGGKLTLNGDRHDQAAPGDQDPIVRASWDEVRKVIKASSEGLHDLQQVVDLEVSTRGATILCAFGR
jgi:hypothetical protein